MATEDDKLILDLKLGLDDVNRQLATLGNDLKTGGDKAGKTFGTSFKAAFSFAAGIGTAVAGAIGAVVSVRTLKEAISAASQQEDAINKLNAALAQTGQFSQSASLGIQEFASARQAVTRFGDEVTLQSAALIQSLGRLDTEGLKRATAAAQDLSAALGIDLNSAALLVGKAAQGQISSFQRYGVSIQKGANDAETFANALTKIEQAFGGRAIQDAKTFSGSLEQLKNVFGDVLEVIGDYIIRSPTLIKLVSVASSAFLSLGESIKSSFGNRDILGVIIGELIKFSLAVNDYVIKPIEFIVFAIKAMAQAAAAIVSAVVALFTGLGSVITNIFAKVGEAAASLAGIVSDDLAKKIRDNLVNPFQEAADGQQAVFEASKEATKELIQDAGLSFERGMSGATSSAIESTLVNIQSQMPQAAELVRQNMDLVNQAFIEKQSEIMGANQAFWAGLYSGFDNGAKSIEQRAKQLGTQVQGAIGSGFANGFAAMGAALVNGQNLLKSFGAAILSSFGDILIMLGQQILLVGALMQGVPFLFGLQGAAAIAAGIGMIVAGGALKAIGGNISASNKGSSATGGIGAPSGSVPTVGVGELGTLGQIGERDRGQSGATVQVTVQGNVFNQKEAGLEIAKIIQDSFDLDGVRTVTA